MEKPLVFIITWIGHACSGTALAQSTVDPASKMSWSENCGYMNWFDAGTPAGSQGARIDLVRGFAEGMVWAENIGWINLGHGGPYANTTGGNFGVNVHPTNGALSGLAWGENVGWVNFSGGSLATPANPARVDVGDGRLRGYAWGENIGWINLDVVGDGQYVRLFLCPADINRDGGIDSDDVVAFFGFWDTGASEADFNADGGVDSDDVILFFGRWDQGC